MAYHITTTCLVILHIVLIHCSHNTTADINCTKFTYCISKYADIYKSLTSEENSFNIESALYPSLQPSSLIVKVQIHGHNNTFVGNYAWSLNCLYAAVPARVLEFLSLGAILVTPRTQDLTICIPDFCSNFSSEEKQKDLIKSALAALEDVAIRPGTRDPRLNTAKCVTEGHTPNITATGRSSYIRTVIWSSCLFVFLMGPYLSSLILRSLKAFDNENRRSLVKSAKGLSFILFLAEFVLLILVFIYSVSGSALWDIYVILGSIFLEAMMLFVCLDSIRCTRDCLLHFVTRTAANLSLYHFCWLVVGIMTNPTWGLVVLLTVSFFCLALTFALFMFFEAERDYGARFACIVSFFGVLCLVLSAVSAGQSFYGRSTADDFLRTVLLYVLGALISWISWKNPARI
ncbi:uncharacterized protein [Montipora foliosa]|uniref:uncharacterized protein n=1 Tax=Montipora foliosa TaxID=591990 RepID=UPI0035F1832F